MAIGNRLLVVIDADVKGAIREIDKLGNKAEGSLSGTDAKIDKFANGAIRFGAAVSAGAAVAGVGLYKAAQQASDLNESITKSDVVFGKSANSVVKWAGTLADSFGLSKREALEAAGGFGSMFRTTGLAGGEAAKMSKRMTELAGDMASFNNEDPSEMLDRLRSGLAGEAEPLRRFGVLLSEARVQSFAYANGIAAAGSKLTEAQKVQARYGLILKDTKLQQGDFARTADGAANSQRRFAASWDNLTTSIGQGALPILQKVTGVAAAAAGGLVDMDSAAGGVGGKIATIGTAGAGAVGGILLLAGAFAKLKVSLADNAAAMPKVAAAAKGLGALTALAVGILEVKDAYEELKSVGEGKAKSLTDNIAVGSPGFVDQLDKAQQRLNKLSETYEKMGEGNGNQRRLQAFGEVFQKIAGADVSRGVLARSAEIRKLEADITRLNAKQTTWVRNLGGLRSALGKDFFGGGFVNEATLSTTSIQRVADALGVSLTAKGEKGKRALQEIRQALIDAGGPTDEAASAIVSLALGTDQAANASGRRKAALEAETEAEKKAKQAIDDRRIALLASFDSDLAAQQGAAGLADALNNATDPLEKKAILLRQAGLEAQAMGDKLRAAGVDTSDAQVQSDLMTTALQDLANKYPGLSGLVQGYITDLQKQRIELQWAIDHPNITQKLDVQTPDLDFTLGKIERLVNYDGSTVDIYVKEHDDSRHGHRDIPGLASGGPVQRGKAYVVGEEGPELFMPSSSGRIINARDSVASLKAVGGNGGGNSYYTINVQSLVPTAATGQLIREHLHKAERAGVTTSSVAG